jgi:hypothetical protein
VLTDGAVCNLVFRIVENPRLLGEIETALDSVDDAERGRRTSTPEVADLVDALLGDPRLQARLRALLTAGNELADAVVSATTDEMLRHAITALRSNPLLPKLCVYSGAHPAMLQALARAVASPCARGVLLRLVAIDEHGQGIVSEALQKPELLTLLAAASRAPKTAIPALCLAVRYPDAPAIGLAVKNLDGLPRWAVDKILKSTRARSSIRAAH